MSRSPTFPLSPWGRGARGEGTGPTLRRDVGSSTPAYAPPSVARRHPPIPALLPQGEKGISVNFHE
jgi:hypothetical protein